MRSKIQLPAWSKLFSKPLFVLFECGIFLSALQASLNLHQHYFWRPESTQHRGGARDETTEKNFRLAKLLWTFSLTPRVYLRLKSLQRGLRIWESFMAFWELQRFEAGKLVFQWSRRGNYGLLWFMKCRNIGDWVNCRWTDWILSGLLWGFQDSTIKEWNLLMWYNNAEGKQQHKSYSSRL